MKLKINKACDLASISALPPRRNGGSGGGAASASASAAAAGAAASQQRSQTMSQQSFSQSGGSSFSQGVGSGDASFSQGRGGGGASFSLVGGAGASFSQGGGGGGAAFSQGGGGVAFSQGGGSASLLHSQSQISQPSLDENLLSLRHPSPARDQRFALPDDSSKRMSSFSANSVSVVHEEYKMQLAKISSNPIHRCNPSLPDFRCQMNDDIERKFQHLASSVHKMGMVLDSVQNDVMQLNRAMKEAALDSDSLQKKFVIVENSLQQIVKGQDDLQALLEGSTKSNTDQLSVLNSHASKLDEISSTLPVLKHVQADLRQLKGDIFRILTKEMEGIVRAVRSLSSRPDAMQTLADQSSITNRELLELSDLSETPLANGSPPMNQRPVANGSPLVNQRSVADGRRQIKQTPVANGRPQMKQTPEANGRPQMNHAQIAYGISKMNQVPKANGKPLMKQTPVTKVVPAPLVCHRKVGDQKPEAVKAGAQNMVISTCCRVSSKQVELAIPKVYPQVPSQKAPLSVIIDLDEEEGSDGSASCVIVNTETGAAGELLSEEETSEDVAEILRRARKRRRREQSKAVVLFRQ